MKKLFFAINLFFLALFIFPVPGICARAPVSEASEECLGCHSSLHPGIVEEWQKSRHAMITPQEAMGIKGLSLKVSAKSVPEPLLKTAVGCAECHGLRPDSHADTFTHNNLDIHVIVSPDDCAVCHTEESSQYSNNIMAHARKNLAGNTVYQELEKSIIGKPRRIEGRLEYMAADQDTGAEACYYCHGTKLEVKGLESRETFAGEMDFPRISGWPNQGAGRVNTDNSLGSCSACHARHLFSIETARKPHTCRECHLGPDVPAYKVYMSSKHGNIYSSMNKDWNFKAVPWTAGKDFNAPTCASCHISLIINTDGETISKRTHEMSSRLSWRIFGLIYAHPHPVKPDTTIIRNKSGLTLPADFDGTFASEYLVTPAQKEARTESMQNICRACHSTEWVKGHWKRFENTIQRTNADILTATNIMEEIWSRGYAKGMEHGKNPFDEPIERIWCETWLFYGNTIRFTSAMAGGGDYGVFADGRYQLSRQISQLHDWLELRKRLFPQPAPIAMFLEK
ncbi:Cytochrome c554 domain-containing protein [Desulfonema limicola]|uniref:Cytochrome c554 domain-containing protein n=1 Tax=Desulfonema limicola TaxID=45656 RepID=A0A975GJ67_9BACT|nr:multiheme c-type cytochrome [Desulfonema limicola]QTA82663.1 Cytochrome c554 domain-containing protein [Desulfonema limicola]